MPDQPDIRIGDRDRLAVQDRLRDAYGQGALDLHELEERLDLAMRARTQGDLAPLVADLPAAADPSPQPTGRTAGPADDEPDGWYGRLVLVGAAGLVVLGILSGYLQPPVVFGSRTITVGADSDDVRLLAVFGSVEVVVEEGATADARVAAIFGSSGCERVCGTADTDVTITGLVLFGSVEVTSTADADDS